MPRNDDWVDDDWDDDDDFLDEEEEEERPASRRYQYRRRASGERKRARRRPGFYQTDSSDVLEDFADEYQSMDWSKMEHEIRAGRYTPTSRDPWAAQVLYQLLKENESIAEKKRKRQESERSTQPAAKHREGGTGDPGKSNR